MPSFQPRFADWEARIRDSFSRQPFMTHLGASMTEAEPGRVVLEAPFKPELTQQHGFFHAGVSASLADSAGGYAGFSLFPENSTVLTVEFKINLLTPAQGEFLRAVGQVIKSGRTLTVCNLEVYGVTGSEAVLCAAGQQTVMCLTGKPDSIR